MRAPSQSRIFEFSPSFFPAGKCEVGICSKYRPLRYFAEMARAALPKYLLFFLQRKKVEERDAKIESEILLLPPFKNAATIPATGTYLPGTSYLFLQILQKNNKARHSPLFPKKILHNVFSLVMFLFFLSFSFCCPLPTHVAVNTSSHLQKRAFPFSLILMKRKREKTHFPSWEKI